jgi:hypothetical protein
MTTPADEPTLAPPAEETSTVVATLDSSGHSTANERSARSTDAFIRLHLEANREKGCRA